MIKRDRTGLTTTTTHKAAFSLCSGITVSTGRETGQLPPKSPAQHKGTTTIHTKESRVTNFCSMKRLGILLLSQEGMLVHRWVITEH